MQFSKPSTLANLNDLILATFKKHWEGADLKWQQITEMIYHFPLDGKHIPQFIIFLKSWDFMKKIIYNCFKLVCQSKETTWV